MLKLLFAVVFCFQALINNTDAKTARDCLYNTKQEKKCRVDIVDLSPTQPSVGYYGLSLKKKEIEDVYERSKGLESLTGSALEKYRKVKTIPMVIGPNKKYYIIDGHHTARGFLEARIPNEEKYVYVKTIYIWKPYRSKKIQWRKRRGELQAFWNFMEAKNWVYLRLPNGKKIRPVELPKKLEMLKDDPYRSLVSLVKMKRGFKKKVVLVGTNEKVKVPFYEFMWADFYRMQDWQLESSSSEILAKYIDDALILVKADRTLEYFVNKHGIHIQH